MKLKTPEITGLECLKKHSRKYIGGFAYQISFSLPPQEAIFYTLFSLKHIYYQPKTIKIGIGAITFVNVSTM